MVKKLSGRIALITGASRGLGAAVAEAFAKEGVEHLILLARSVDNLEKIDDHLSSYNIGTTLVPVDLRDFDRLNQLGEQIHNRFRRLDVFVGNGAILGPLTPLTHTSPQDWNAVMETNFYANWHLLRTLDPCLKASSAGRGIFVTSKVAPTPHPYWGAYSISKASLEAMVRLYAAEQEGVSSVKANLVDPGTLRTDMMVQAAPGGDPNSRTPPEEIVKTFIDLAQASSTLNGERICAQNLSKAA
ncbi:MAG: SDR family NAD(P)-dependent oxidoreductase [bacterium]|nr:SDR family NAD(P)-dependent oxidoreductase [bacterium]